MHKTQQDAAIKHTAKKKLIPSNPFEYYPSTYN
jgi:hypothetical protein